MRSGEERPALIWRTLALRLALVVIPGWFTVAVLIFSIPMSVKLAVGAVLVTSLISPAAGLVAVAAAAPIGELICSLIGVERFRLSEAFVLAFLTAWVLSAQADRRGPGVPSAVGWLPACRLAASSGGLLWQVGQLPGELARTVDMVFHAYYFTAFVVDRIWLVDAARLLEG